MRKQRKTPGADAAGETPEREPEDASADLDPAPAGPLAFAAGTAIDRGGRDYQEDALDAEIDADGSSGIVVLADGMGGHAAGNVASEIVIREVFEGLRSGTSGLEDPARAPGMIAAVVGRANDALGDHIRDNPDTRGMGSTVVAAVLLQGRVFWTSVGDSPLYLLRDGTLRQLNEDHSMAPQIDYMAKSGLMTAEQAANHPNRNCLTSALTGTEIPRIDTPPEGFALRGGDFLVVSSDGLQFLHDEEIAKLVSENRQAAAQEITDALLKAVLDLGDPAQDNVSCVVVKVEDAEKVASAVVPSVGQTGVTGKRRLMLGD